MESTPTTEKYRAARDVLQELSQDYATAVERFAWPDFGDRFNWGVDWFDAVARDVLGDVGEQLLEGREGVVVVGGGDPGGEPGGGSGRNSLNKPVARPPALSYFQ